MAYTVLKTHLTHVPKLNISEALNWLLVMYSFHTVHGPFVELSSDSRTAERTTSKTDFDGAVLFSAEKLIPNTTFKIRLDKKINIWSGGLEFGVTCIDVNGLTTESIPKSATELRNNTWLMTGGSILHDGKPYIGNYGFNLEQLEEQDTVGLMRTSQGSLVIFVQGISQGVAVPNVPEDVYCVVSLYGKCCKVSIIDVDVLDQRTNVVENTVGVTTGLQVHEEFASTSTFSSNENNCEHDKLRFHQNCGPLVKFSNHNRTAERRRPLEEFNNCVVLTHRPLRNDELFQIRIDTLIHKWSGSIEFGIISNNPENFNASGDFPATLTVVGNGTVVMSGNGVLHDGRATNSPYANNLDQLQEGDRIGIMRQSNGDVVYFVNGESLGVATNVNPSEVIWGCCNLYGMAAKVTIVDKNEREEHNLRMTTRTPFDFSVPTGSIKYLGAGSSKELLFHPNCGIHAAVINNGRTAHRPESMNDFNHGVVLTNRFLLPNEMFEIRLDKIVPKWAGSIEIGVTTHAPTSLEYPCTMTNVRSGTWMQTGNGIMHNGQAIVDDYGLSLDKLKVGDCVGVLRKENGNLHFFVNGVDQGCAASNIPENVYGVIDLYGQAAQATIVNGTTQEYNGYSSWVEHGNRLGVGTFRTASGDSSYFGDLKFHHLHGKNARILNNGLTACKPNAHGEFNAAIVISSRPLKDNEMFEVIIERMVDRWSGNIEAGVTSIKPENLMFPNTMTDIDHDTVMLSGSSIMSGGHTITNSYPCNLDCLTVGSKVGMMRKSNNTLHFFVNGEDMGAVPVEVPSNIYAVVDLYGQCAQVSITRIGDTSIASSQVIESLSPAFNDTTHRFSVFCGKNIAFKNNNVTATRMRHYNNGLVFSAMSLDAEEIFEVKLSEMNSKWAGTLEMGITALKITDENESRTLGDIRKITADTWYISGCDVYKNLQMIKQNYCANLSRLTVGDKIGVKITSRRNLIFLINGEELGIAASYIPEGVHVVVDVFGSVDSVTISSTAKGLTTSSNECLQNTTLGESIHSLEESPGIQCSASTLLTTKRCFSMKHSRNIELSDENRTAKRLSGYQGFVFSERNLQSGKPFEIRVDKINSKWESSLMIGVLECNPENIQFPFNALGFKKSCWLIIKNNVFRNGVRVGGDLSINLNTMHVGDTVGVMIDECNCLHLLMGEQDCIISENVSSKSRALVVLYGEVEQVSIVEDDGSGNKDVLVSSAEKRLSEGTTTKSVELSPVGTCSYLEACLRFKSFLWLPDAYFVNTEAITCLCPSCWSNRTDTTTISKQGDPPMEYELPVGWVRFPINITLDNASQSVNGTMTTSSSSLSNVLTTWHVAYYGVELSQIRPIIDIGRLTPRENFMLDENQGTKDEQTDSDELIFSPIIDYASRDEFSPPFAYMDSIIKRQVNSKAVFQILVQPGSYKVGPPTLLPPTERSSSSIQWSTKEQGATHISALLVKLDGIFAP